MGTLFIIAKVLVVVFIFIAGFVLGRWEVRDFESMGTLYIDNLDQSTYLEFKVELDVLSKMKGCKLNIRSVPE